MAIIIVVFVVCVWTVVWSNLERETRESLFRSFNAEKEETTDMTVGLVFVH